MLQGCLGHAWRQTPPTAKLYIFSAKLSHSAPNSRFSAPNLYPAPNCYTQRQTFVQGASTNPLISPSLGLISGLVPDWTYSRVTDGL